MSEPAMNWSGANATPNAPASDRAPNLGVSAPSGATSWHRADFADLVTAKGWKGPDDVLKSYAELEKFRGAPPDRLIRLPEKPDDPAWTEIRSRVGLRGPDRPEDYELAAMDGLPKELADRFAKKAHELGVPKEMLRALAAENDAITREYMQQQDGLVRSRIEDLEREMSQVHGQRYAEVNELAVRELQRLGIEPAVVEEIETTLAARSPAALRAVRQLLIDVGMARREAPFHEGATLRMPVTGESAAARLKSLQQDPEWVAKALTRGTPQAEERIALIAASTGRHLSEDEARRLASGVAATG